MSKQHQQMSERELLGIIGEYEKSALGSNVATGPTVGGQTLPLGQEMTTLEMDNYAALNTYMARPFGNEIEGRSQVVLPELRDTVEWIMPQLIRIFLSTDKICRFEPENADDEEQVELEAQIINYLFMNRNNGFFVLYDYFKDALLLRNGYSRVYYEEYDHSEVENYTGLTEDELAMLLETDDQIEILEQSERVEMQQVDDPFLPEMPPTQTTPTFDIKLRRTITDGRIRVECIPNEETLVSPEARRSLDDCPFVEHKRTMPRSDVIEMGFSQDKVYQITNSHPSYENLIALARDSVVDQLADSESEDKSMQTVLIRTVELRVDFDGDGVAELRRVILGGDVILENEEISEVSIVSCSPMRMPHRHVGISYYDLLADLQLIKSTILRQTIDNIFLANNQRTAVNSLNVNMEDMLVSRPGGIIRVKGAPGENIMPLETGTNLLQQSIPAMEYIDSLREMRTGIGKDTMGLDADALQDVTKGGQLASMSAARMKVELVARLLAEGVKDIFVKMHGELRRHQDKPIEVKINGKWLSVNPSEWRERTAASVTVGLGSGQREEARANLMLLGQMQEKLQPFGLIGPKQAYETFKHGCTILGFENPEMFAMDPGSEAYKQYQAQHPPQVAPNVQVAQIKAQTEAQKAQLQEHGQVAKLQSELMQAQQKEESARMKSQAEILHAQNQLASSEESHNADLQGKMAVTLLQVIGDIVAQQLKGNTQANAGQMVADDYREAKGEIE